jgi:LacI family transcriptional regulator
MYATALELPVYMIMAKPGSLVGKRESRALATIYDVASQAGVSIKTVSRVMNAEPNVRDETRARVQAAAAALNYHPNLSARSLAGSRSYLIAVIVDAKLTLDHWRSERGSDYLSRIQLGAIAPCREAGYHLLIELIDHDRAQVRQELESMLGALKPDGVILTPPSADDPIVLACLRDAATPYVRLGPESEDDGGLDLRLDDKAASRAMTEYLAGLGHRRIGFIEGDRRYGSSRSRREGFLEAMAALGLEPAGIGAGDYTYESGYACAEALLGGGARPTAIFASNDDMAQGCIAAAMALGLDVPNDMSVAGFDDSSLARFSRPPLTTLRQPIVEMAALAARALIEGTARARCGEVATARLHTPAAVTLPHVSLVTRLSTAPPRR